MTAEAHPRPRGLAALLDDRWNPILVKEVRQALRGRYFRITYSLVLIGAIIAAAALIIDMGTDVSATEGRGFFTSIYFCLMSAMLVLVPVSAFTSMGSEWEENTYDLLVISNLRPRQILLGKALSAMTQSLLYLSAFAPFLVFAFLLRGVDLVVVVFMLGLGTVLSFGVSIVSIFLSTLSRQRFVRIFLLVGLTVGLSSVLMGMTAMTDEFLSRPGQLRNRDFALGMGAMLLMASTAVSFCFMAGCNLLAHAEENRSTNMRVLTTVLLLVAMAYGTYLLWEHPERELVSVMAMTMVFVATIVGTFFATEAERLGRWVAPRVPRDEWRCWLAAPFLPGGSRGLVLYALHLAAIVLFLLVGHASLLATKGGDLLDDGAGAVIIAALFGFLYVGLPSGLFSQYSGTFKGRSLVRVSVPLLILVVMLLPGLVGFFLGDHDLTRLEHPGNPFWLIDVSFRNGSRVPRIIVMLMVPVLLIAFANLPRIQRGIVELAAARRKRVEPEAREAA